MSAGASSLQQRILALALAAAGFVFALCVGELLVRGLASAPQAPLAAPAPVKTDHPALQRLSEIYNRNNVRGYWRGVFVRTNSHTLRGPEYSSRPRVDAFRIAIGGDSFTMGLGVEEENTYPMQLEKLLAADRRALRPEVLNVGLSGINLAQAVSRLGAAAGAYHPDLLVYGFTTNDIEGRYYRPLRDGEIEKSIHLSRKRFDDSASRLLRLLWPRWISLREWIRPTPGSYSHELDFNYFENPAAWNDVLLGLDRLAELAQSRGVCGHVLIHTSLGELGWLHPERRIHAKLAAAARERGLTVTQSFPYFRGRRASELWVRPFDPHPNREGNGLLAQALYDGLHALPASCWRVRR